MKTTWLKFLATLLLLAGGCSETVSFRIVDAVTFKPIPDCFAITNVERLANGDYVDRIRLACSPDHDNIMRVKCENSRDFRTTVEFFTLGYYNAAVQIRGDEIKFRVQVSKTMDAGSVLEFTGHKEPDGSILVKMYPGMSNPLKRWTDEPQPICE